MIPEVSAAIRDGSASDLLKPLFRRLWANLSDKMGPFKTYAPKSGFSLDLNYLFRIL
jgi:hypothetical protein